MTTRKYILFPLLVSLSLSRTMEESNGRSVFGSMSKSVQNAVQNPVGNSLNRGTAFVDSSKQTAYDDPNKAAAQMISRDLNRYVNEFNRDSSSIIDPTVKLLEDADDAVQKTGKFTKQKLSTTLLKQIARVVAIANATTSDMLNAGIKYTLEAGFKLSELTGSPIFQVAAMAYSTAQSILNADKNRFMPLGPLKPLPVTGTGPELTGQLVTVLADPAWSVCASSPANPQCQTIRFRAEALMDQILTINYKSIPEVFGSMAQFYYQLNIAKQQLIAIWLTLQGDKGEKPSLRQGLQNTIPLLNKAVDDQSSQLERAYDVLNKDIQSRYDIFGPEIDRLTKEQDTASKSIVDFGTRMTGVNQLKLAVQIHKFENALGDSLFGVSKDARDILNETDEGMKELKDAFELYSQENDPKLKALNDGLKSIRSDVRTTVKSIQESYKAAQSDLLYAARTQQRDFKKDADRMMLDIPRAFNMTLNKGLKEGSKNATIRFVPINVTLGDQLRSVNASMSRLIKLVGAHFAGATDDVNKTSSELLSMLSEVVRDVDIKSIFFSKQIMDTAKLQADELARARELGAYANDRGERLRRSASDRTVTAKARSSALYSSLINTVSDGMTNMTSDVTDVMNKASLKAAAIADGTASGIADIRAKFFSTQEKTSETVNDASEALATQNALTKASIQQLADISKVASSQREKNLNSALSDASITAESLLSQSSQSVRDLASLSFVSIDEKRGKTSQKINTLQNSLDSIFGNLQSDIVGSSKQARQTVDDAFSSVDSVGNMQYVVGNRAKDLKDKFDIFGKNWNTNNNMLWSNLNKSSQVINSTARGAVSRFNTTLASGLNKFLSSLNSAVSSTSSKNSDAISHLMTAISENYADTIGYKARMTMENFQLQNKLGALMDELGNMTAGGNLQPLLTAIANNQTVYHVRALRKPFEDFLNMAKDYSDAALLNVQDSVSKSVNRTQTIFNDADAGLEGFNNTVVDALDEMQKIRGRIESNQVRIQSAFSPFGEKGKLENRFNSLAEKTVNVSDHIHDEAGRLVADVIQKLADAQDELLRDSNATRLNASGRFDRVENLIKENLEILNQGMKGMTGGFSDAASYQSKILSKQDEKFVAVAKEIATAIFASQLTKDTSNEAREKAEKTLAVVVGLIQALKSHDDGAALFHKDMKEQILDLGKKIDASLGIAANGINFTIDSLSSAKLKAEISRSQYVGGLISKFGPTLDSNAAQLLRSRETLIALTRSSAVSAGKSNADAFTMEGMWKRMSDKARGKLESLIDQVRRGSMSVEDAMRLGRKIDVSQMQSAQEAVDMITRGMMEYLEGVHAAFDGSQARLAETGRRINQSLEESAGPLMVELELLRGRGDTTNDAIEKFGQGEDLDQFKDIIGDLQNQVQGNQTAVNGMLEQVSAAVDRFESELNKRENDYETYIQTTIDNVTANVASREKHLKEKLSNRTNSLVQLQEVRRDVHRHVIF